MPPLSNGIIDTQLEIHWKCAREINYSENKH